MTSLFHTPKARWAHTCLAIGLLLGACRTAPLDQPEPTAAITQEAPTPTSPAPPPTHTPSPVPSPTPSTQTRQLTICTGAEPDTLFPYGGSMYVADLIRQAIYDGPIDPLSFDFQPVILEKLPSLADGDAVVEPLPVQAGDRVVNAAGETVILSPGEIVRPAGCRRPACAQAWDGGALALDQLSATFTLLAGLLWSDGEPLTAQDSVFSYDIARNCRTQWGDCGGLGLNPPNQATVERTASYAAIDGRTVRWTGLPGYLDPSYRTNFFIPLPEHQLGRLPRAQLFDAPETRLPLGWGPYVLERWTPGERIVAERNPLYFRANAGLPYFDRVIFRFVGEDLDRNLDRLESGACDVLTLDTYPDADLERVAALRDAGKLGLYASPGQVWEHLSFGIRPAPDHRRPDFFGDARIRQAVAHCIDRRGLVDALFLGLTVVPDAYISPHHPLFAAAGLATYPYDPRAGESLLEETGWRDADGDGVREAHAVAGIPDGTPLVLAYQTTTSQTRGEVASRIGADLAACGISVEVSQSAPEDFFAESPDGQIFGRRFDLAQFAWLTGPQPPCELFISANVPSEGNRWTGTNATGYSSPAFDAACQDALESLPGTEAFARQHLEALRLFSQDLPALPLYMRFFVSLARTDLIGLAVDPTLIAETWNIEVWRLAP